VDPLASLGKHGLFLDDAAERVVGRPDRASLPLKTAEGVRLLAKVYPDERGETTFTNMTLLWESSFGGRRTPPGLPRPLRYLHDSNVLVMERLEGRTLLEVGDLSDEHLDAAARLLADLHEAGVYPKRNRSSHKLLLSAWRKVDRVAELAPRFAADLRRVVEALDAAPRPDAELVACHGEFSPRNLLVGEGRHALLDWDRLQRADPARDVAYFGTWCWVHSLRQRTDDWSVLDRFTAAYLRHRPHADPTPRLAFHVAVGLLRIAQGCVEHWPEDVHLVPRITAEALRRLS